jgi:hypothetical protein
MTKSKGVGRGGPREGAGRRPKVATVDWEAVAKAYYVGSDSLDDLLAKFGLKYADLLAYGADHHWMQRRPKRRHPDDLGDLAGALAEQLCWVDIDDRQRRFVAAMAALGARTVDIAEVLQCGEPELKDQFKKELAGAR